MLSKIGSALQTAADIVAPPCAVVEDFDYHWKQVLFICLKCHNNEIEFIPSVEETRAIHHLTCMLNDFVEEESSYPIGSLSPCLEYVLKESVLLSLVSYAWADKPLGIQQHIYIWSAQFLKRLNLIHIHQSKISKPLQILIKTCKERSASPYEREEVEFLSALCEKIFEDRSLVLFFIQCPAYSSDGSSSAVVSYSNESQTLSDIESDIKRLDISNTFLDYGFPLADALLHLCNSADNEIVQISRECLLKLIGLKESKCSEAIVQFTKLSYFLVNKLITLLDNIPLETEPALFVDIQIVDENLGNVETYEEEELDEGIMEFPGRMEVLKFLEWLSFCDKFAICSDGIFASDFCNTFRLYFLEKVKKALLSEEAEIVYVHMALLTKVISVIKSTFLINCFISWMLDSSEELEGRFFGMNDFMFKLCRLPSYCLQMQAFRLFQIMIEKPGGLALQILVLNYLNSRAYFDNTAVEQQQASWSDEEEERDKSKDELKSTSLDDFESYKLDAQRQYYACCQICSDYSWPTEAISPEYESDISSALSRESNTESESGFYEGPFLKLLMDFLKNIHNQDYDINLQVTSIISTLALFPHPFIHEYLLNTSLSLAMGVQTPYSILTSVVEQLKAPIMQKDDFHNYLRITRFRLLGTMEEFEFEKDEHVQKFEALIVIEEFTKELAAIAYAKYKAERG